MVTVGGVAVALIAVITPSILPGLAGLPDLEFAFAWAPAAAVSARSVDRTRGRTCFILAYSLDWRPGIAATEGRAGPPCRVHRRCLGRCDTGHPIARVSGLRCPE